MCAYKIEEWLQLQVKLKSLNTVRWGEAQGVKWVENSQSSTSSKNCFLGFLPN